MTEQTLGKDTPYSRTQFERISLPTGQLSVVKPLPADFPSNFSDLLIDNQPWKSDSRFGNSRNKALYRVRRRVELCTLTRNDGQAGSIQFVLKEMAYPPLTFPLIADAEERQNRVLSSTPTAQIAIIDKVRDRYKQTYGKEFSLEEPLGFYIDRETTQKFMFFRYYKNMFKDATDEQRVEFGAQINDIADQLMDIGVSCSDSFQFLLTTDNEDPTKLKPVLIDTEFLRISPSERKTFARMAY